MFKIYNWYQLKMNNKSKNRLYVLKNNIYHKNKVNDDIIFIINSYLYDNKILMPEELKLQIIIYRSYQFTYFFNCNYDVFCHEDVYVEKMVNFLVKNQSYEKYANEHKFDKEYVKLLILCVKKLYKILSYDYDDKSLKVLPSLFMNGNFTDRKLTSLIDF